jgi:hypothetical protein
MIMIPKDPRFAADYQVFVRLPPQIAHRLSHLLRNGHSIGLLLL